MIINDYTKELLLILNELEVSVNEKSEIEAIIKGHIRNEKPAKAFTCLLGVISESELDVASSTKEIIYLAGQFVEMDKEDVDEFMKPLPRINLQSKTKAQEGEICCYWFENKNIGLKRAMYHRFIIPLVPFDSELEFLPQPEEPEIIMEWIQLAIEDPFELDGLTLVTTPEDDTQSSVYIGTRHNPCDIKNMVFKKVEKDLYHVSGELFIEFEYEMVAKNEYFQFETLFKVDRNIIDE